MDHSSLLHAPGLAPPWDPEAVALALLDRYARPLDDALAVVAVPRR